MMINETPSSLLKVMQTGETAYRIHFGETVCKETLDTITEFMHALRDTFHHEIEDMVPSYTTLTVYFNKEEDKNLRELTSFIKQWQRIKPVTAVSKARRITIPVCYEDPFSIDRNRIEEHTGLPFEEIIHLHTDRVYITYMIGFLPGFPYLGELNEKLSVDRLDKPRLIVPKGTVGIGGSQTGIYPIESPGGWNILGKTPLNLFSLSRKDPFLICTGDEIQFSPISIDDYYKIENQLKNNPDTVQEYIKEFPK